MKPDGNSAGTRPAAPSPSSSERVARAIVRGLYEGTFVPGQRLVEPDVMEMFGASRSTVREAIKRLETDGVVDVLPYRGAQIRRLGDREARDALLVIEYCTGLAARLAAERIGEGDNRALFQQAFDTLMSLEDREEGFDQIRTRSRFYRVLALVSGSRDLQRFIPSVQVHLLRNRVSMEHKVRFADYRRIGEAILSGNGDEAENACRDHIRKSAQLVHASASEDATG